MTPEIVEARYRAAQADARAAREAYRAALNTRSKALLDKLLKKPPADRLQALENSGEKLLRAHRRILMRSLWNAEPARREIIATTASWYEVWRSRLPYRVFPMAVVGLSLGVAIVLAVTAYHHTPLKWVTVNASEAFSVRAQGPNNDSFNLDVLPGERFALMRTEGDKGVLRYWLDGEGYAEFQLTLEYPPKDK